MNEGTKVQIQIEVNIDTSESDEALEKLKEIKELQDLTHYNKGINTGDDNFDYGESNS